MSTLTDKVATEAFLERIPLGRFEFWQRHPDEKLAELAELRRVAPVSQHVVHDLPGVEPGLRFWAVTGHAEVYQGSRLSEFSSAQGILLAEVRDDPTLGTVPPSILTMDGAEHLRLRSVVNRRFTPRAVGALRDSIRDTVVSVLDDVAARGECEFVKDVAARIPMRVICALMGIPDEWYDDLISLTNAVAGGEDSEYAVSNEDRVAANFRLLDMGQKLADLKVADPGEDLTSLLVASAGEGERISPAELASFLRLLVAAGNETTRNAIAHALRLFSAHPEQKELLLADFEGRVATAIEEILRMSSPVNSMVRTAVADVELGGRTIRTGDKVMFLYSAANRDPDVFANADAFDIGRDPNPHMAFGGGGAHFCLGAHLARLEVKILLEEMYRRLPDIVAVGEPDYLESTFVNGIKRMNAFWSPA
ncbi:cytochrome P450 [Saccharopolyspora shandongensis]|uniref:cytochrome P450 n=1 Tax=Saccharopolyspora shandongensis TaxID=418495 RepID=UPI0033C87067